MLIITHKDGLVIQVKEHKNICFTEFNGLKLLPVILKLASLYQESLLIWVDKDFLPYVSLSYLQKNPTPYNEIHSFEPRDYFISKEIGYVEDTPFINVNKNVKYATWLQSTAVGVIQAKTLLAINSNLSLNTSFKYYLNAISKASMPQGLRCYSNPYLLDKNNVVKSEKIKISNRELYKFIRQHYKKRWLFLVAFQILIFEKRLNLIYPLISVFKKKHRCIFNQVEIEINNSNGPQSVDVIIPTMGRKQYLYDVLMDLKAQTLVPKKVIIVEQNADKKSISDLDYLKNEQWPFKIDHTFIHQTGACNARNVAIEKTTSNWVFLADDDIRIPKECLTKAIAICEKLDVSALTLSCLQKNENEYQNRINQWIRFGSGSSFLNKKALANKKFHKGYEFGYGEDSDFGMQLRNDGFDILYVPEIRLLHLKAPIGGFRLKQIQPWDNSLIKPKPSPTVMLFKLKYLTKEQFNSYKFSLYIKYYKNQTIINPFKYVKNLNKAWDESVRLAYILDSKK